ncbi:uncharacterized protein FFFS_02883 [Fusarium fujikuroi]|nr:uncharacterized protein FFFS_02883 [Fusarium fujikuroi]
MAYTFEFPLSVYLSFIRFAEHNVSHGKAIGNTKLLLTITGMDSHAV